MACLDIETLGFHGAFYAFLHICFTSCSEIIAGLLLSRMLKAYCQNVILNLESIMIYWPLQNHWCTVQPPFEESFWILCSLMYWSCLLRIVLPLKFLIPKQFTISGFILQHVFFFLIPLSFSQLVILQHVYFNRVKINEPQWLKEISKYCVVQFTEQGAPLITFK